MKKRKLAAVVASVGLCGTLAVGGTIAYLTDNEATTNNFTVGRVQIDLTEPDLPPDKDEDGVPDDYEDLVPNQEVPKNPTVTNTGTNEAIVFVSFDIPMAEVITTDDTGKRLQDEPELQEVFYFSKDVTHIEDGVEVDGADGVGDSFTSYPDTNSVNEGWLEITGYNQTEVTLEDGSTVMRYVYGYNTVLAADDATLPVFDVVKLVNVVEDYLDNMELSIPVRAYAIQADYLEDKDLTNNLASGEEISQDDLISIYEVFSEQNDILSEGTETDLTDYEFSDADTENKYDILADEIKETESASETEAAGETETEAETNP